jgi:hypothetical protein
MSYQDPPRHRRSSREDSYSPYQDYQPYQSYQDTPYQAASYQDTPYQGASYKDTRAGYRNGNGYAGSYRGFAGQTGGQQQSPPWDEPWNEPGDDAWQQPTEWEPPRRTSGPFFAASDDDYDDYAAPQDDDYRGPRHSAGRGLRSGRGQRSGRGLLAGGLVGFLAAAVAIGVANLVAAFVRPQASPIIAVGGAFIDRTPPALKNFAVEKFGENDKTMLLLGMYVTIALIAIVIGMVAWRRVAVGVAGIGLFGLFGAFVAITRPESHVTDVIPSVIGGITGIVALVWLVRAGARRPAYRLGRTL